MRGPDRHPHGSRFTKAVTGTTLYEVDEDFARTLVALGEPGAERYRPDPVLKKLTGWPLISRGDVRTPPFSEAPFRGRATLVRRRAI